MINYANMNKLYHMYVLKEPITIIGFDKFSFILSNHESSGICARDIVQYLQSGLFSDSCLSLLCEMKLIYNATLFERLYKFIFLPSLENNYLQSVSI